MPKNILIMGLPRSGKSTLLKKIIQELPDKVGLREEEIRQNGQRTGFEMYTHRGTRKTLASVGFESPYRVSRYGVKPENLEALIPEVSSFEAKDTLYLDEIGQMELFSEKFKELVLSYLNSENACLATISLVYQHPFIEKIKKRPDVLVFEITEENREQRYQEIKSLLGLKEK